jgi:hypothetical protein
MIQIYLFHSGNDMEPEVIDYAEFDLSDLEGKFALMLRTDCSRLIHFTLTIIRT